MIRNRRLAGLAITTLSKTFQRRRPIRGLIFHSGRGAENTAEAYRAQLTRHRTIQGVNRLSRMNDNAFMESFFHTMKAELNEELEVGSVHELRRVVGSYVDHYTTARGQPSLADLSPAEFAQVICYANGVNKSG